MNPSLLLISDQQTKNKGVSYQQLSEAGYMVHSITPSDLQHVSHIADAMVLDIPVFRLPKLYHKIHIWQDIPFIWWCDESEQIPHLSEWEAELDSIVYSGMNKEQIKWAIWFGIQNCRQKKQWREERNQLIQKLEERKWIEQAKGILQEWKQVSETKAYQMLRQQAMNERRKIADIASAIVKAYPLLGGTRKGGGSL
ncbi:ANTAR domain-containing response regulator [Melghirimyces algeriensis]|uniref:Response regulator NasT n=1 Tax=Melghirimyces algeriensis TaxID=910412 RepID=A0A521BV30_9BACL|nr:ANTAR domain-containing protein [Melghirimyces algeriensis]SMO51008.1 response regulator NasT [Melghirimyces algeriensis]